MRPLSLSLRATVRKAPTAMRLAILGASLLMSLPVLTGSALAQSASSTQQQSFSIPAGPLATVLNRFATEAGVVLSFDTALTAGKQSQGLSGNYSVAQGFAVLLAGAGLQAVGGVDNSYVLVEAGPSGSLELSATSINANGLRNTGNTSEDTGSYTIGQVSVTKLPNQSIKDTPQSISVITRQRMDDQHMITMHDALTQTTGIVPQQSSMSGSGYLSRGFRITNYRVDGGLPVNSNTFVWKDMDLAIYDHVEILRGADGLYSGNGEPGGTINLVRKRPTAIPQFKVTQSLGSWDNYRTELDIGGPLGFDGRLRGRSIIVYQDSDSFIDRADSGRKLFHGVLEADLTDSTLFTVGYTHDRYKSSHQIYGLPRYRDGSDLDLPRSSYLSGKHDWKGVRADYMYARVEQQLDDDWSVTLDAMEGWNDAYSEYYSFEGAIDPVTHTGSTAGWFSDANDSHDRSIDVVLKGSFDLLGGNHNAVLGYTWRSYYNKLNGSRYNFPTSDGRVPAGDIFAFDPGNYPSMRSQSFPSAVAPGTDKQSGIYGSLRLQLAEPLHLILGGRYNDYSYDWRLDAMNANGSYAYGFETVYEDNNVFTPFVALTYSLSDEWTAYASVADIYLSQAIRLKGPPENGSPLEPIRGRAHEIGIKGELFDGRLNTSTALYYVKREGEAVRDPSYSLTEAAGGAYCCYVNNGQVTSKGLDFEVSGQVTERLEGTFGYTYNHNESTPGSSGAMPLSQTPRHLGRAFFTYRMSGALENLRIGGGASVQSATYLEEGNLHISESGYTLYNAFADYRLNENWSVALNGNNLTDKKYYVTVGNTYYGNAYGDPRNFTLTLRGSY